MEDNEVHDLYTNEPHDVFVEDEGDEDNLGVPIKDNKQDIDDLSTVDDDVVVLGDEALDDSNYNDNTFDCD
ncbi:hypothetical protein IJ798_00040 [Candidatus Saccharibacteria bacterium]|nr:hypothetical protein [Candidatus Saccharibacteria bacterium]